MINCDDLRSWNLIKEITAGEAALLIGGVNPARTDLSEIEQGRARVYERAIRDAVNRADFLAWNCFDDQFEEDMPSSPDIWETEPDYEKYLPTFEMRNSVAHVLEDPVNAAILLAIDPWYSATVYGGDFNDWLKRNELQSGYEFKNSQSIVVTKLDQVAALNAQREANGLPALDYDANFFPTEQAISTILTPDTPLGARERNTLLCIIGALCKEAKFDYKTHAKTAGLIQSTAAGMGVSIGETTIEGHLKKISTALASRMK